MVRPTQAFSIRKMVGLQIFAPVGHIAYLITHIEIVCKMSLMCYMVQNIKRHNTVLACLTYQHAKFQIYVHA